MALPELAVMQQTFELLYQLDPPARRRVIKWVRAALDEAELHPTETPVIAAAVDGDADDEIAAEPVDVVIPAETPAVVDDVVPAPAVEEQPAAPEAEPEPEAAPAPAPAKRRRAAAKKAEPEAPAPTRGRKKAAAKTPEPTAAANGRRGRPEAEEIMRVYESVGGKLTDVAKHYGKPYPTIQGWASALRKQGYQIGRSRDS
jgi:outer membrane biosynthesis protein TonB